MGSGSYFCCWVVKKSTFFFGRTNQTFTQINSLQKHATSWPTHNSTLDVWVCALCSYANISIRLNRWGSSFAIFAVITLHAQRHLFYSIRSSISFQCAFNTLRLVSQAPLQSQKPHIEHGPQSHHHEYVGTGEKSMSANNLSHLE